MDRSIFDYNVGQFCRGKMLNYHKNVLLNSDCFPSTSEIQIYLLYIPTYPNIQIINKYIKIFDEYEIVRFNNFKYEYKKIKFLISRLMLKSILARYLSVDLDKIKFETNPNGKLFLRNEQNFKFNLSHTDGLIATTLCLNKNIGIDVEKIKFRHSNFLNIAARFFTENEKIYLQQIDRKDQLKYFYKIFTLKEAYLKAVGLGFRMPLNSFDVTLISNRLENNELKYFSMEYKNEFYIANIICNPDKIDYHYNIFEGNWSILESEINKTFNLGKSTQPARSAGPRD